MALNHKRRIEKLEKLQKKPQTIEEICDEVREAGWPSVEITRHGGGWMVKFRAFTKYSRCTISAIGRGKTIIEAMLQAKGAADDQTFLTLRTDSLITPRRGTSRPGMSR